MSELSIEITSRELAELVNPVTPCAGTDDFTPILKAVRIESRGAYLTASATDRFRVGVSRIKPAVTPPAGLAFTLGIAELKRIQAIFKGTRHTTPSLRLTVTEAGLRVESLGGFEGFSSASMTFSLLTGDFPRLAPLIANHDNSSTEPVKTVALNAKFLAAFQHAVSDGSPLVVRSANYGKPVIVTVGDYFIGALMPTRRAGEPANTGDPELTEWIEMFGDDAKKSEETKAA